MAQAQLGYFKEAQEIFSGMLPEIEALLKTQEITYRQSSSDGHSEQE
jgi:hypothetical protein